MYLTLVGMNSSTTSASCLSGQIGSGSLSLLPITISKLSVRTGHRTCRATWQKTKELQKLLDCCVGPREHIRVFILIMADSAFRLTEAKRLTRGQIDFEAGIIYVK